MENEQKIIALLEKISSNQEVQIKQQLESLEIQRGGFEKAQSIQNQAERIQGRAERIQKVARNLIYVLAAFALLLFMKVIFKW